ncbi:GntR family transcriptional regulator, partial [Streptomyces violaceoruber]
QEILRLALAGDADGAARALHAHIASFVERAFPEAGNAAQEEDGQA